MAENAGNSGDKDEQKDKEKGEREKWERDKITDRGQKIDIFVYAVEIIRSIFGL